MWTAECLGPNNQASSPHNNLENRMNKVARCKLGTALASAMNMAKGQAKKK